jgi:hypothetical protein
MRDVSMTLQKLKHAQAAKLASPLSLSLMNFSGVASKFSRHSREQNL